MGGFRCGPVRAPCHSPGSVFLLEAGAFLLLVSLKVIRWLPAGTESVLSHSYSWEERGTALSPQPQNSTRASHIPVAALHTHPTSATKEEHKLCSNSTAGISFCGLPLQQGWLLPKLPDCGWQCGCGKVAMTPITRRGTDRVAVPFLKIAPAED